MPNSSFLRGRSAVLTAAALASVAAPAAAAWTEPVPGESPLNVAPTRSATDAAVASVGGVPYVAWREEDGSNNEVRVARLVTTGWERVGATAVPESPVNNDSLGDARSVSLADVNGVPYVAWAEFDGTNTEVRVARPTADGTGWERVGQAVNAASPVNVSPSRNAVRPTIANVNGAPWVTWTEDDGTNAEVRVARLRPDGLGWERVGEGVRPGSPINRDPKRSAFDATLAVASGVPYVAWAEGDGTNTEIRVARPNAAGTGWVPVGQTLKPASPVNANAKGRARGPALADWGGRLAVAWVEQAPGAVRRVHASVLSTSGAGWEPLDQGKGLNANRARPATAPRIAVVAGGLWATWAEFDGQNREVRVARLATAGGRWEQVPAGVSPVNASAGRNADAPAIADVTNVPYVAWVEADAVNREMRASRLQPDFTRLSASGTEERVAMTATMRTYGLPYQVGFQISGGGLARATRPGTVSGDPATTSATASRLRSGVTYQWRPVVAMGGGGLVATGPAQSILTTSVARLSLTTPGAKKGRTWRFRSGRPAGVRVRVNLRSRLTVVISGHGIVRRVTRAVNAGITPVRLAKVPRKAGTYRVRIAVRASGGRTAAVTGKIVIVPRRR